MLYTWEPNAPRLMLYSLNERVRQRLHKNKHVEENLMRIVRQLLGAAIAAAVISSPVMAEELTGTLKKIKDSGTITLGHRDSSIPFSYLAGKPEPVGYSPRHPAGRRRSAQEATGHRHQGQVQPGHLANPHPAGAERHRRPGVRLYHQQRRAPAAGRFHRGYLRSRHPPADQGQGWPAIL